MHSLVLLRNDSGDHGAVTDLPWDALGLEPVAQVQQVAVLPQPQPGVVRVLFSPAALAEDFPIVLQQVVEAVQAVVLLAVQRDRVLVLFQCLAVVRACREWQAPAHASLAAALLVARLYAVFVLPLGALVLVPAGHPDVVRPLLLALPERTVQQLEDVAQAAVLLPKQLVQVLLVPLADDGAAGVAVRAQRVEKPLLVRDVRAWRGLHAVLLALLLMSMTSSFTSPW